MTRIIVSNDLFGSRVSSATRDRFTVEDRPGTKTLRVEDVFVGDHEVGSVAYLRVKVGLTSTYGWRPMLPGRQPLMTKHEAVGRVLYLNGYHRGNV